MPDPSDRANPVLGQNRQKSRFLADFLSKIASRAYRRRIIKKYFCSYILFFILHIFCQKNRPAPLSGVRDTPLMGVINCR